MIYYVTFDKGQLTEFDVDPKNTVLKVEAPNKSNVLDWLGFSTIIGNYYKDILHEGDFKNYYRTDKFNIYSYSQLLEKRRLPKKTLDELEGAITQWSYDRGILTNGSAQTQGLKLMSEMGELADNLAKGKDVRDDIGDCFVVLVNIARLSGTNIRDCVELAYNEIKDRKGFLNENGAFIKSTDEGYEEMYKAFLERRDNGTGH